MPSGKQLEEWTAGFDLEELVEAGKRGKKRAAARQEKYESVFIARAMKRRKANADDPDAELAITRIKPNGWQLEEWSTLLTGRDLIQMRTLGSLRRRCALRPVNPQMR